MVTKEKIIQEIEEHDEQFVTASEIADKLGVARQTAYKHLQRMHDNGDIEKKKIGGSAVIWWNPNG